MQDQVRQLLEALAPRAPGMIITIYGDVVMPRGGVLWMGTLIEIGAALGLNESLVRTAVSRLVAAEQLVGERDGRRSFYRLADSMRQEFSTAARLLYGVPQPARGWILHHAPDLAEDAARRSGLARIGPGLYLRPDHGGAGPEGLAMSMKLAQGAEYLPEFAAAHWPLADLAGAYDAVVAQFAPLDTAIAAGTRLTAEAALVARLLLVHAFRAVQLNDPRLPHEALPPDWPGKAARALFARLYLALSPAANSHIGARFEGAAGPLPARSAETQARLLAISEQTAP